MTTPVGIRIKRARLKAGYSQTGLGKAAGVGRSWVASVETGRTPKPGPLPMGKVARVLGIEPRELLALTDQLGDEAQEPVGSPRTLDALVSALHAQTEALDRYSASVNRLVALVGAQGQPLPEHSPDPDTRLYGDVLADLARDAVNAGREEWHREAARVQGAATEPTELPRRR